MARNPALASACRIIAARVGITVIGQPTDEPDAEILHLAGEVGMIDEILSSPGAVAREITAYLDDMKRNP